MEKWTRRYSLLALIVFNTLLLLVGCNVGLWLVDAAAPHTLTYPTRIPETDSLEITTLGFMDYGMDNLRKGYPNRTDYEIVRLLTESWNIPLVCDEEAEFRESQFHGEFVKVDAQGFRWGNQRPAWPPDDGAYNIFVFGGSTTFGYAESDSNTIPTQLQDYLRPTHERVTVYNFGRGFYFSKQEFALFQQLMDASHVPDLAIFIDGLNDFYFFTGEPYQNNNCRPPLNGIQKFSNTLRCEYGEACLPMQMFNLPTSKAQDPAPNQTYPPPNDAEANAGVVDRWLATKTKIETAAVKNGVEVLFVMQPVPAYQLDFTYHAVADDLYDLGQHNRSYWGYTHWNERYVSSEADWTHNVLNLSHLGADADKVIYVDNVHYTAAFMEMISQEIGEEILARGIVP